MIFLKRQFPLLICFAIGVAMALQYYVPTTLGQKLASQTSDWYIIITIFASFLGFGSVASVHWRKVNARRPGWGYSALVFVGIVLMLGAGIISEGKPTTERAHDEQGTELPPVDERDASGVLLKRTIATERIIPDLVSKEIVEETAAPPPPKTFKVLELVIEYAPDGRVTKATETKYSRSGAVLLKRDRDISKEGALLPLEGEPTSFGWMYQNMLNPLQSTMFAMLGFYIASAAFRSFRAKSFHSGLLLVTALVVLIGNVPFTNHIWSEWFGIHHLRGVRLEMPDIVGWLMNTPNTAARRGVGFGVALGIIATSLKIIFGIERAYLGGGD
ncbi:MAG: hypothetical protein HUU15_07190 [Candidatus Brocadiae bacterium]|nr:hypothetical protein [Candidatus Brocadiia bacterium]